METSVIVIYAFKALVILAGLAFVYMGYNLFIKGITAPAGSFIGEAGDKKIKLLRFAPGIFFALVGTVVVVVGSTRTFSIKGSDGRMIETEEARADHGPEEFYLESSSAEAHSPDTDLVGHGVNGGFMLCDTCDLH